MITFGLAHADEWVPSRREPAIDVEEIGAKAASLVRLTALGMSVPPGFVIPMSLTRGLKGADPAPDALSALERFIGDAMADLEAQCGRRLGDPVRPLLVSVRSGGAQSQPGMLETILNVGVTEAVLDGLVDPASGSDASFAADVSRRFHSSWKSVVGGEPPDTASGQLHRAVLAIVNSWDGERARSYRNENGIDHDGATAVTVQVMVFGNRNDRSGSGVAFSAHPVSGESGVTGDFLFRSQGSDVVDGTARPDSLTVISDRLPTVWRQLTREVVELEQAWGCDVDVEFTIDDGALWILQCRPMGPTSLAEEPRATAGVDSLPVLGEGTAASRGRAVGRLVVSVEEARNRAMDGQAVVLFRPETSPADVSGMRVAEALVTSHGGMASHAAIVAREWNLPAVVGVRTLTVVDDGVVFEGRHVAVGTTVTVDADNGRVLLGATAAPEVGDDPGTGNRGIVAAADTPHPSARIHHYRFSDTELLHAVLLKGSSTVPVIAAGLVASLETVAEAVQRLSGEGLLAAAPDQVVLTNSGRKMVQEALDADAEAVRPEIGGLLDEFGPVDMACKSMMAEYQLVSGARHDPSFVQDFLASLRTNAHEPVVQILDSLSAALPRVRRYVHRLDSAIGGALHDHALIAHPLRESYHMVWFELHEDLLRLAGRRRSD